MNYQKWLTPLKCQWDRVLARIDGFDKRYRWAKYIVAFLLVAVYTVAFGDQSLVEWYRISRRESYLKDEIEHFQSLHKTDSSRLSVIKTQTDRVERIARERYLMKSPGEDIYIIKSEGTKE